MGEKFFDRGAFNNAPFIHHRDFICQVSNHAHVVSNNHDGGAIFIAEIAQQLQDFCLHRNVQCRRRLIGNNCFGAKFERHGNHDALFLSAGKFMWIAVDTLFWFWDTYRLERSNTALTNFLALNLRIVGTQSFRHLPPNGKDRIHGTRRLLENHGDIATAHLA